MNRTKGTWRDSRPPAPTAKWIAASLVFLLAAAASNAKDPRTVVSLDGTWTVAEGQMAQPPLVFEHKVPVPGLITLARPGFTDPGPKVTDRRAIAQKDPRREAFWYRRTFRLKGTLPEMARVKVGKAMFGTRVVLNGQTLGDHLPSFTPGYFDARSALRSGENEILIRVGADRDAVGPRVPTGFDFEKERYIPGIFDSVELILSGTPHIAGVQAAPDIAAKTVRVQAVLRNDGEPKRAAVSFVVREAKSNREVGRLMAEPVSVERGRETVMDVRIPITNCRLWSPEDPFLYSLEIDSGADRVQTRFGMREFRFDPASGRAMLNGKPYFMRGSNFTVYRFFEDDECRDLPWKEVWVRRLHERVKEMHWNCLRYCIGFPPERWYEIADEVGLLIQDEFPIWHGGPGWSNWPKGLRREELATEYEEWMRERWNHPCVVIWDANNETSSTETGPAIAQVRHLDLSNRPWDNSYTAPQEPGDVFESHPYHFQNAQFRLADLAKAEGLPQGNPLRNDGQHAAVINEYGWLWLNRDGTPTTLTRQLYLNLLGITSTTEQRRRLYATYTAAETEFWRAHRKAAAVMHFTTLGYSRKDGQTSDHWLNVAKLRWEPEFKRYVRDSFSPVGLMIDYWNDRPVTGTVAQLPVALINDLDTPWSGRVTLRLKCGKRVVAEAKQDARIDPFGLTQVSFPITWPEQDQLCRLEAELHGATGKPVLSVREVKTIDARSLGLAYGKPATASSVHSEAYQAANAVDGDSGTYWSSSFADGAWLAVDLGEEHRICRVRIMWEAAYAKGFSVEASIDGQQWTQICKTEEGKGGTSEISFAPVQARHVRLVCTKRGTEWGNAVRELAVFE